jgi:hypothetical protein
VTIEAMRNPDVLSPFVSRFHGRARPLKSGKRFNANACGVQNRKLGECYLWSERDGIADAPKQRARRKIIGTRRCSGIARHEANDIRFPHHGSKALSKDWVVRISFHAPLAAGYMSLSRCQGPSGRILTTRLLPVSAR